MKILILGGTVFVGRVIVEAALDRNHEVTIFNRGKVPPRTLSVREENSRRPDC